MKNSTALGAELRRRNLINTIQIIYLHPLMMKDTGLFEVFWSYLEGWPRRAVWPWCFPFPVYSDKYRRGMENRSGGWSHKHGYVYIRQKLGLTAANRPGLRCCDAAILFKSLHLFFLHQRTLLDVPPCFFNGKYNSQTSCQPNRYLR